MINGELKSQIDSIWNVFWSGGISNPLEVIEQITYLLFLRRLDDLHTLEENKSTRLKRPMERHVFPEGNDPKGRPYEDLRWSHFKHLSPAEMFTVVVSTFSHFYAPWEATIPPTPTTWRAPVSQFPPLRCCPG